MSKPPSWLNDTLASDAQSLSHEITRALGTAYDPALTRAQKIFDNGTFSVVAYKHLPLALRFSEKNETRNLQQLIDMATALAYMRNEPMAAYDENPETGHAGEVAIAPGDTPPHTRAAFIQSLCEFAEYDRALTQRVNTQVRGLTNAIRKLGDVHITEDEGSPHDVHMFRMQFSWAQPVEKLKAVARNLTDLCELADAEENAARSVATMEYGRGVDPFAKYRVVIGPQEGSDRELLVCIPDTFTHSKEAFKKLCVSSQVER